MLRTHLRRPTPSHPSLPGPTHRPHNLRCSRDQFPFTNITNPLWCPNKILDFKRAPCCGKNCKKMYTLLETLCKTINTTDGAASSGKTPSLRPSPSSSNHSLDIHWTYWWHALIYRIISNRYPVTIRMSCLMTIFSGYWYNKLFLSRKNLRPPGFEP